MAVLDDLSGFEFEDLIEDVFRELGYENVRQAERVSDAGRDVVMEEVIDGERRAVIVECKHTGHVGRPVVQKLHSAVATYEYDGPRRGVVVTTGRFSNPAREYVAELEANDDPYPVESIDGTDLREIAEEIGLDLYNGRIEILCEETLRPYDRPSAIPEPMASAVAEIENVDWDDVPDPAATVRFEPVVTVVADVDAVFETSVGVVHRVDERSYLVIRAGRGQPTVADAEVAALVGNNTGQTTELDEEQFEAVFDEVAVERFGKTQTEYQQWALERFREQYTTTVRYTGDNNVTYTKTCEPNLSDVIVQAIDPVYLPVIELSTEMQSYTHSLEYYAAGPSHELEQDRVRRCVHCGTTRERETYTFCANCGSINCTSHTKTERLVQEPVCTGCAVTDSFVWKRKYFYDESNLAEFRKQFDRMPIYEKILENSVLTGVILSLVGSLVLAGLLAVAGGL
jgi:restriction endonuclease Mrr